MSRNTKIGFIALAALSMSGCSLASDLERDMTDRRMKYIEERIDQCASDIYDAQMNYLDDRADLQIELREMKLAISTLQGRSAALQGRIERLEAAR